MTDPDELYTLRAQYWLGHYQLCLDEARTTARRPMSPALKAEREEFVQRAHLALGAYDKVTGGDTGGLKGVLLKAQYEQATTEDAQNSVVEQMKALVASEPTPNVQLYAAQLFLQHGMTKDALKCVHMGVNMEHTVMALQIYLKLDRIDLAQEQLSMLRGIDEDAVLTSLGSVHVSLAQGRSTAGDALHVCNALSEQYGPSPLLLNLMACAHLMLESYEDAEQRLLECKREFPGLPNADTLINLIVCSQYLGKDTNGYLSELQEGFSAHPYCKAYERVMGAFERESIKYKVSA